MKEFLKYFLASFLAVCLALVVIFLIGLGSITALVSSGPETVSLKPSTVLLLDIDQHISERTMENPLDFIGYQSFGAGSTIGLHNLATNLEKAAKDPNIKGILIRPGLMTPGVATLDEIRDCLADFKASGKFVAAYSETYSQGGYYVASVADRLYLNPEGILELRGLRAETMYFKNALEKLGVEVQIIREGRYKSAVEPFMLESMSDFSREQTTAYLQTVWTKMLKGISESRGIGTDELDRLADGWVARTPEAALQAGLVDSLLYEDQVHDVLLKETGLTSGEKLRTITIDDYSLADAEIDREYTPDRIAIVYGTGSIGMETTGPGTIGTDLAKTFAKVRKDGKVKAVVFRINSPGGNALASEIIRREVELTAAVKPVVVSMGDVAGSGGYWIATPGTKIVAGHSTLTGSIGAFGLVPNMETLMTKKLGITFDGVQTNRMAGAGSVFRPLTDEERTLFEDQLTLTYNHFLQHVANTRGMTVSGVDSIGQGRIWAGVTAKEKRLVDEIGGLKQAVELAASEAGLKNWRIRELPVLKNPVNELINELSGRKSPAENILAREIPGINEIRSVIEGGRIQARVPFSIGIR